MASRYIKVTRPGAQASTNDYAVVDESIVDAIGSNTVRFLVVEQDVGAITARVVGRFRQEALESGDPGGYLPWTAVAGTEQAIAKDGSYEYVLSAEQYHEYAVQIKATVAETQGSVKVYGGARDVTAATNADADLTLTAEAEDTDVIAVAVQSSVLAADTYYAEVVDTLTMVPDATVFTLAETGAGAEVAGTTEPGLIFTLSAGGAAELSITDVAGDSGLSALLRVSPLNRAGTTHYLIVVFD